MTSKFLESKHEATSEEKLHAFGYGPWVEEVDYAKWEYKGIICQAQRNDLGCWCGYIEVPKDHPWFDEDETNMTVDVHGGLTYAGNRFDEHFVVGFDCAHSSDICPFQPSYNKRMKKDLKDQYDEQAMQIKESIKRLEELEAKYFSKHERSYKDINFVIAQCESLVDQMLDVKEN